MSSQTAEKFMKSIICDRVFLIVGDSRFKVNATLILENGDQYLVSDKEKTKIFLIDEDKNKTVFRTKSAIYFEVEKKQVIYLVTFSDRWDLTEVSKRYFQKKEDADQYINDWVTANKELHFEIEEIVLD